MFCQNYTKKAVNGIILSLTDVGFKQNKYILAKECFKRLIVIIQGNQSIIK